MALFVSGFCFAAMLLAARDSDGPKAFAFGLGFGLCLAVGLQ